MDITIPFNHIQEILKTRVIDKEMLNKHMSVNEPEIIAYKEKTPPMIKVTFSRLEPEAARFRSSCRSLSSDGSATSSAAISWLSSPS